MNNTFLVFCAIILLILPIFISMLQKLEDMSNNKEVISGPTSATTSAMKLFYFVVYAYIVITIFDRVFAAAADQWTGFAAVPKSDNDRIACYKLFALFVVLEGIHFFRIYTYLHCLEEPLSKLHRTFIRPIYKHKYSRAFLIAENAIRLVLMVIVSLKFIGFVFVRVDAFRMFALYLLLFYSILMFWDLIVCKAARLHLLIETFFIDNLLMIISLVCFINVLPRSIVKIEEGTGIIKYVLADGEYTHTLGCLFFMCAFVFLSIIIRTVIRALFFHYNKKKEGDSDTTWGDFWYDELAIILELWKEVRSILNPHYGVDLSK